MTTPSDLMDAEAPPAPMAPAPRARFLTPSVAMWALLGGLSVSYLIMTAVKPGMIASYIPIFAPSAPEDNQGQRATVANDPAAMRENLSQLQLDVAKIKTDLAAQEEKDKAIETRLTALEDFKRAAAAPIATAAPVAPADAAPAKPAANEASAAPGIPLNSLAPAAATLAPGSSLATPPPTAAQKAAAKKAAKELAAKEAAAKAAAAAAQAVAPAAVPAAPLQPAIVPAQPAAPLKGAANAAAAIAPPLTQNEAINTGVKLINAPLSQSSAASKAAPAPVAPPAPAAPAPNAAEALAPKLETGSVQNLGAQNLGASSLPEVQAATAATKPIGIYIGSGPSIDSLRSSWNLLSDRNAASLKSLQPRYTTSIDESGLSYGLVAGPVRSAADARKICGELTAKAVTCKVGDFTGEAL